MNFRFISESTLEKLTNLEKLQTLRFEDCENLTGNVFTKIVNSFNLVELEIINCKNITLKLKYFIVYKNLN